MSMKHGLEGDQAGTNRRDPGGLEIVIFKLEGESFGVDINKVSEITRLMEITKVPRSLPFIEGIVNLRGKIIPVVDLRRRLGFPDVTRGGAGRIVIVRMEGFRLGLLVDSVSRVAVIPRLTIEKVPPSTLQIDADVISGIGHLGEMLILLLDLSKILTPQEMQMLAEKAKTKTKAEQVRS